MIPSSSQSVVSLESLEPRVTGSRPILSGPPKLCSRSSLSVAAEPRWRRWISSSYHQAASSQFPSSEVQPIGMSKRASSATESMCYRLPTWRHGLVRVWLHRIILKPHPIHEQEPPLRLRSGRGRSLYILFQSVASLYCFNLSSTSLFSSLLLQVFPVETTSKQPTHQHQHSFRRTKTVAHYHLRNIHIPSANTHSHIVIHCESQNPHSTARLETSSKQPQSSHFDDIDLWRVFAPTSRRQAGAHQAAIRKQID
jgi:hypothetical protein